MYTTFLEDKASKHVDKYELIKSLEFVLFFKSFLRIKLKQKQKKYTLNKADVGRMDGCSKHLDNNVVIVDHT